MQVTLAVHACNQEQPYSVLQKPSLWPVKLLRTAERRSIPLKHRPECRTKRLQGKRGLSCTPSAWQRQEVAHASAEKQSLDGLLGNDQDKKDPTLHLASHLRAESCGLTSSPPPRLHVLPFGTRTKRAQHKHWGVKRGKRLIAGAPPVPWREGFSLNAAEPPSFNRTQCIVEQGPPLKHSFIHRRPLLLTVG